ncbi:MAG: hypothetical protein NT069_13395 [Planctomycetota bacterium]|nr:hypothetical protein [Planctomycetota bacterium]
MAAEVDSKPSSLRLRVDIRPVTGEVLGIDFAGMELKSLRLWDRSITMNDLRELYQRKSVSQFRTEGPMKSRHIACDKCLERGIDNRIAGGIRRSNRVETVDAFPEFIDLANNR